LTSCGVTHPERELKCLRVTKNHPIHTGRIDDDIVDWPNEKFKAKSRRSDDANKTRKILREMASRTERDQPQVNPRAFYPSEDTLRGRVALYLLKYVGEWVGQDELEHPTIARSAAVLTTRELMNYYGWPIEEKAEDGLISFRLTSDPRM